MASHVFHESRGIVGCVGGGFDAARKPHGLGDLWNAFTLGRVSGTIQYAGLVGSSALALGECLV